MILTSDHENGLKYHLGQGPSFFVDGKWLQMLLGDLLANELLLKFFTEFAT